MASLQDDIIRVVTLVRAIPSLDVKYYGESGFDETSPEARFVEIQIECKDPIDGSYERGLSLVTVSAIANVMVILSAESWVCTLCPPMETTNGHHMAFVATK